MTVNIPQAVCTYIVMYMVLEYCSGVSLSEPHTSGTGVDICVYVYACLQPLAINPTFHMGKFEDIYYN